MALYSFSMQAGPRHLTAVDLHSVEYAPRRIVFADACFENSEQKSNVRPTLKDKGIAIKAL